MAQQSFSISILSTLVVLALLFSFGLHSVQIAHEHPGHATHSHAGEQEEGGMLVLGEYMHMADKKLFVLLAAALFVVGLAAILKDTWHRFVKREGYLFTRFLESRKQAVYFIFQFLEHFFSRGVLHPKLH